MKSRYENELRQLEGVYSAALDENIRPLAEFIEDVMRYPLMTVGSGGSYTAATFATLMHQRFAGKLAKAAYPLEIVRNLTFDHAAIFFSASGGNKDICSAFKHSAETGVSPINAVIMKKGSSLESLANRYSYSKPFCYSNQIYRDGFLAVATLIATSVLLLRAYVSATNSDLEIPETLNDLLSATLPEIDLYDLVSSTKVTNKDYVSVLYSDELRPVAVDLESRFIESALGAVHTSDFRNFGHGRHVWFARNPQETGIIALVSTKDKILADDTLQLIPCPSIFRLDFKGPPELVSLSGLVVGLYVSAAYGRKNGIDPSRPGVGEFGRKLFSLGPKLPRVSSEVLNKRFAILAKTKGSKLLEAPVEEAYEKAMEIFSKAQIRGIVVDYDGTICDKDHRRDKLPKESADAIQQCLTKGIHFGIATGRGESAGRAMRMQIPEELWNKITIGYYNGAIITDLATKGIKEQANTKNQNPIFESVQNALGRRNCEIRSNDHQITIEFESFANQDYETLTIQKLFTTAQYKEIQVVSSDHSIDILLSNQSKLDVVRHLAKLAGCGIDNILRIGDRGIWPGNDYDLLNHKLGLSVDEASRSLTGCWVLAPAGLRGVKATLWYLNNIGYGKSGCTLNLSR